MCILKKGLMYMDTVVFPRICVEMKLVDEKYGSFYEFEYVEEVREYVRRLLKEGMLDWFSGLGWYGLLCKKGFVWFKD